MSLCGWPVYNVYYSPYTMTTNKAVFLMYSYTSWIAHVDVTENKSIGFLDIDSETTYI